MVSQINAKCILIVMLPVPSHYLASFGYARFWQGKGYDVVYTALSGAVQFIQYEGFKSIEFQYSYETRIESFRAFWGVWIKNILDRTLRKKRYRTFLRTYSELDRIVRDLNPEKIMLDEHLSDYYFFVYSKKRDIQILNTKLSTKKAVNSPPLDSSFVPDEGIWSKLVCYIIWKHRVARIKARYLVELVAFLRGDESGFQKRIAEKNGLIFSKIVDFDRCLYRGIKDVETIILAPEFLEFSTKKKYSGESYFFINENSEKKSFYMQADYLQLIKNMELFNFERNKKIVYCCFGTLPINNFRMHRYVLPRLLELAQNNKDVLFVICMPSQKMAGLPNILTIAQLPQPHFLQYVDLMIGHGGLGSIKDCLLAKVPMLICPTNSRYDQVGNGARVLAHGIGLVSNIALSEDRDFFGKIETLLFNPIFRKQLDMFPLN